jgi:hypothetical protein
MANTLAELSRSRDEYFLAMVPLLIDWTMRAFSALLCRQLGLPPGGHQAMQPGVVVPMICFAF